jgi:hypothetical protein
MQKISKIISGKALAALLLVSIVSSCATQSENSDTLPPLEESAASLLDPTEVAMPVGDEAAVFADLATAPEAAASEIAASAERPADSTSPFYNPIGGESLGRVAYTLYGNRNLAKDLVRLNPDLQGVGSLRTDQRVYFDMDRLNPVATHLTKDLLDRYPAQLAEKIQKAGLAQETVTVGDGETLQEVSQRLYGTTRYWTEIYLLNRESISNYDRVPSGTQLKAYQRGMVSVSGEKNTTRPANKDVGYSAPSNNQTNIVNEQEAAEPVMPLTDSGRPADVVAEPPVNSQAPAVSETPAAPVDPIPETPAYTPPPVAETPPQQMDSPPPAQRQQPAAAVSSGGMFDFSNTANLRRIIYVALILVIGIVAFVMTRSSKKKSFDMLDVTTDTTGTRPKLGGDVDNHKNIG